MTQTEDSYLTGQLLIAMPAMDDPRFAQCVILLCAHTDEGAMGIVLNRPLAKPTFEALLEQLDVEPTPPARQITLCQGGPVDHGRGFVLHTNDWTGDGSLRVDENPRPHGKPGRPAGDRQRARSERRPARPGLRKLGDRASSTGRCRRTSGCPRRPRWRCCSTANTTQKWRRALGILRIDPLLLSGTAGHA